MFPTFIEGRLYPSRESREWLKQQYEEMRKWANKMEEDSQSYKPTMLRVSASAYVSIISRLLGHIMALEMENDALKDNFTMSYGLPPLSEIKDMKFELDVLRRLLTRGMEHLPYPLRNEIAREDWKKELPSVKEKAELNYLMGDEEHAGS